MKKYSSPKTKKIQAFHQNLEKNEYPSSSNYYSYGRRFSKSKSDSNVEPQTSPNSNKNLSSRSYDLRETKAKNSTTKEKRDNLLYESLELNWSETPPASISTRTHTISPVEIFSNSIESLDSNYNSNTEQTSSPLGNIFVPKFVGNTELNYLGSGMVEVAPKLFLQSDYYLMTNIPSLGTVVSPVYTSDDVGEVRDETNNNVHQRDKNVFMQEALDRIQNSSARSNISTEVLNSKTQFSSDNNSGGSNHTFVEVEINKEPENRENILPRTCQPRDIFPIEEISETSVRNSPKHLTTNMPESSSSRLNVIRKLQKQACKIQRPESRKAGCLGTKKTSDWIQSTDCQVEEFETNTILEVPLSQKSLQEESSNQLALPTQNDSLNMKNIPITFEINQCHSYSSPLSSHESPKQNILNFNVFTGQHLPNQIVDSLQNTAELSIKEALQLKAKRCCSDISLAKKAGAITFSPKKELRFLIVDQRASGMSVIQSSEQLKVNNTTSIHDIWATKNSVKSPNISTCQHDRLITITGLDRNFNDEVEDSSCFPFSWLYEKLFGKRKSQTTVNVSKTYYVNASNRRIRPKEGRIGTHQYPVYKCPSSAQC